MSHLGTLLKTIIEERKTTARAVAVKTGLNEATVSRWISGSRLLISIPSLVKVSTALGRTKEERAEIIAAHLRDQCQGPGSELVSVKVNGKHLKNRVPSSLDSDLEFLRTRSEKDPTLRNLIRELAKLL